MTTRLDGAATCFLPFNQGDHGGSGQSGQPERRIGPPTSGRQVWERDSWLEILGRYLVAQRDSKKQIDAGDLPPLSPAGRHPQTASRRAGGRAGRQIPDPAFRRVRQNQLHRLDGAFSCRPARRRTREAVRLGAGGLRPQRAGRAACRKPSSISSARPAWWPPSRASAAARAASWRRPSPAARRSWSAPSRPFPLPSRQCRNWRRRRASASP